MLFIFRQNLSVCEATTLLSADTKPSVSMICPFISNLVIFLKRVDSNPGISRTPGLASYATVKFYLTEVGQFFGAGKGSL